MSPFDPAAMRQSREKAFAMLFAWSFTKDDVAELSAFAAECGEPPLDPFARELLETAVAHVDEIDALIRQYAKGWKLSRLSATTLAILRQSFCELIFLKMKKPIPVGATINEAVELAKKFAAEDEAPFINGILGSYDKVRRGLQPAPELPAEEVPSDMEKDKLELAETPAPADARVPEPAAETPESVELIDDINIEV